MHDMRLRQEMILGIGGVRALWALNKNPVVCHMNEGHSAFCGLERIRARMEQTGLDFYTVREAVAAYRAVTLSDIARVLEKYPLSRTTTVAVGPLTELERPTV